MTSTPESQTRESQTPGLHLGELGRALRRRWRRFALLLAGTVAVVMGVTFLIPPLYESESSLRVRSDQAGGLSGALMSGIEDMVPTGLQLPGMGDTDVQTEIGVLTSRRLVEGVADSLALHVSLRRPFRATRSEVFDLVEAGPDAPRGVFTLRHRGSGVYAVSSRGTRTEVALPESVRVGEAFAVGPMTFRLADALAADPPRVVRIRVEPFTRMIRTLRQDLRVARDDAGSRLVTIGYRHTDPELARALVNGILDDFMVYSETVNRADSQREVEILSEQVALYRDDLRQAENALQAFQEAERVILPEEQATQQIQRIAELQVLNDALSVERRALTQFLAAIEARPAPVDGQPSPYRQLATFPTFLQNAAIQEFLDALIALENARADLLVLRTEENRDVRVVQDRIREIEGQLRELTRDYLEGLDTQLASSGDALAGFGDELEAIPQLEIEYARRMRDRRLLSEIYVTLQARLAQAQVQEAIDDARVRVVDRGVIEDRAAFPRPAISGVLSLLLGLMVGLFGVVLAESSNPGLRSRRAAEEAAGAPLLAVIPPATRPRGAVSDAAHALALELRHPQPGRNRAPGLVLVAGPGTGEGRSTVAAELARAAAGQGRRVALVDADLRDGALHTRFGVPREPGWVNADDPTAEAVRPIDVGGPGALHLFPAGQLRGHPLDRLSTPTAEAFLAGLAEGYDLVIVDTPALSRGPDARVLAPAADAVLLVARANRTSRAELETAAEAFRRSGRPALGVVLTGEVADA